MSSKLALFGGTPVRTRPFPAWPIFGKEEEERLLRTTTPPIVGHYLVSGGDWKAAAWGAASIVIAMLVYFPFARAAERQLPARRADVPAGSIGE